MAAIVSQLAAANRRRKANKKNHVPIDKCVYILPPFDPCFKPEVHNRYVRHKQAHLAHQEFMARIGTVSPVPVGHIETLEKLGEQRIKDPRRPKRATTPTNPTINKKNSSSKDHLPQQDLPKTQNEEEAETPNGFPTARQKRMPSSPSNQQPPKRGAEKAQILQVPLEPSTPKEACDNDVEMKLIESEEEEFVSTANSQETSDLEERPLSTKCQIVIAILGCLAFIPLIAIVIYLVGMFYAVPDTLNLPRRP